MDSIKITQAHASAAIMFKKTLPDQPIPITQQQLDAAYKWLCRQRKDYPPNADIWTFRHNWKNSQAKLLKEIVRGDYIFSPLKRIDTQDGRIIQLWCSSDALVLKLLAELMQSQLKLSKSWMHIKGYGGLKRCVACVQQQLPHYQFVCKTDELLAKQTG